ncbi:MAG: hypothetical protein R3E97_15770 [Candidatus Eisenbacteria bacterium]
MKKLSVMLAAVLALAVVSAVVMAGPNGSGKVHRATNYVDANGDGYNDLAPDADGDGIPNGADADYVRSRDGSGPSVAASCSNRSGRSGNRNGDSLARNGNGNCNGTCDRSGQGNGNRSGKGSAKKQGKGNGNGARDGSGNGKGAGNGQGAQNGSGLRDGSCVQRR